MRLIDSQSHRLYLIGDERAAFMAAARSAACDVRTFCTVLHDTGWRITEALELVPARNRPGRRGDHLPQPREAPSGRVTGAVAVPPSSLLDLNTAGRGRGDDACGLRSSHRADRRAPESPSARSR
jgi:hypothetical protein